MLLRPTIKDIRIIFYYLGKIVFGIGLFALLAVIIGIIFKEWEPLNDFLLTAGICFLWGLISISLFKTEEEISWLHGMLIVCICWLVAMFLGAIPLYLSGHYVSYLDSCFEAMSGLATTGLTLIVDLDHFSFTHNFWRHLMMFIGGQGIVIVAISFFTRGYGGAFKMYVGEAREERILPSIVSTAHFILLVSVVYLILGTAVLSAICVAEGMRLPSAIFNGLCIFMAGFDTGGFTPYSQNIYYYHSFIFELVSVIIMILGTLNFKLHYCLWAGKHKELLKDIEIITFFITSMLIFLIVLIGLFQTGIYNHIVIYFRKGFYHLISAHTGTGFSIIYPNQIRREWSALAILGLILAMSLGGSTCSTTGAIKALRIGVIFKTISQEIKKILLPELSVVVEKFHHTKDLVLEDKQIRSVFLITLCYIFLYVLGALVAVGLGYPFLEAIFESVSASANVGLSTGITQVSMPALLKIIYILQMWIGRLEFMSIFTLLGFLISIIKGR
ncbi:MAG: TrkH family potassium uptake protein [Candidatus Omnitrophica bacterium]|nr:TrkH family potassium uptake protein [Candidatus Omnitrophota bacterium]